VGLPDAATGYAISKDGALVAASAGPAGTQDGAVCSTTVWDVRTGQVRGVFGACAGPMQFSPDGRFLVNGHKLWGQAGEAALVEPADRDAVVWHGFSADSAWAATSHGQVVRVWNTRTSARQAMVAIGGAVRAVAFGTTKAGPVLAVSNASQPAISLWDVSSGKQRAMLPGHDVAPNALSFSADGLLASVSEDGSVRTWDAQSGKPQAILGKARSKVRRVLFSSDGTRVVLVLESSPTAAVQIGDLRSHGLGGPVPIAEAKTTHLALSPDGDRLAFAGKDGDIGIWSIRDGRVVGRLSAGSGLAALAWARGGATLEAHAGEQILRWDNASSRPVPPLPLGEAGTHARVIWDLDGKFRLHVRGNVAQVWDVAAEAAVRSIDTVGGPNLVPFAGSPDPHGTRIAWPAGDGLALFDLSTGHVQTTTVGTQRGNPLFASWSADGSTFAMVGPSGHVSVARPAEQPSTSGFQGPKPPERALTVEASLSADGKLMLLPDAGTLRVVGTEKAAAWATLPTASSGVYSADAKRIAVRDESPYWDPMDPTVYRRARMWDVERGKYLWTKDWHYLAAAQPLSPDGAWVALTPHDINEPAKVFIVNATTGAKKAELAGCAFLPSGDNAWNPKGVLFAHLTGCGVSLWDGTSQRHLFSFKASDDWYDGIVALAWSPDGSNLATSFGVFDVQSGKRVELERRGGKLPKGLSWTQDGTKVIALFDFEAVLHEASSGRVLHVWEGIERVTSVNEGRVFLVRNLDVHEPVDLWRAADGARVRIATLNVTGEGVGWVAYADDGRFDASSNALPLLTIRMGDDLVGSPLRGAGAEWDRLRTPGLVAQFIGEKK
jgi:WD40 repeat protein